MPFFTMVSIGLGLWEREAVNGPVSVVSEDLRAQGHTGCSLMLTEDLQGHQGMSLTLIQ